jgi:DNA-binding MarR family transcriptional regulator
VIENNGGAEPTFLERLLQLQGDFRTCLTPLNITPLQAGILLYLRRCPGAGIMKMARDFKVQPPTMTPIVQGLVRKGYIVRAENPHNRRALPLNLTYRGQSLVKQILAKTRGIRLKASL